MCYREQHSIFNNQFLHGSLLIFFLIAGYTSFEQSKIKGKVMDANGRPMVYANVLLLKQEDSVMVKGIITDQTGAYLFENIKAGKYVITITHTGFTQKYTSPIITNENNNVEIKAVELSQQTVQLSDVTIQTKKPLFEQKIDRTIVNVANSILSSGNTALDILQRSPGIVVDQQNGSISMNGKDGILLMINGKINRMPINAIVQMLAGMSANNIERIEFITTPPANFDAEGNAGYINIVLKSNTQYGTNGFYSLSGGYGRGEITMGSLNINHRKNKLNLYADISLSRLHHPQFLEVYKKVLYQGKSIETFTEGDRNVVRLNNTVRAGADYEISKKTFLGILVSAYDVKWSTHSDNKSSVFKDSYQDTSITGFNYEINDWKSVSANVNVLHNLSVKDKFNINLNYDYYYDNNPVDYVNSYKNGNNAFYYDQKINTSKKTPIVFWVASFDYSKIISEKISLDAGLKSTFSSFHNTVAINKLTQNVWTRDILLSSNYNLYESVLAGYASSGMILDLKTNVKFGLRYEYTDSDLASETHKKIVDKNYGRLFPSLFLSHIFNKTRSYNFSYTRRVTRPTFKDLAPFVLFFDPYTLRTGNSSLQPSITDAISNSYIYKRIVFSLSYSYTKNPIVSTTSVDAATNLQTITMDNQKNEKALSLSVFFPCQIAKWWTSDNNILLVRSEINAFYKNVPLQIKRGYLKITTTQSLELSKNFAAEISGNYFSPGISGMYKIKSGAILNAGLLWKLVKSRSTLRINGKNILNSNYQNYTIHLPEYNLVTDAHYIYSYPSYTITYTRNFGNDKVKGKRNRTTGAEEERARVQ